MTEVHGKAVTLCLNKITFKMKTMKIWRLAFAMLAAFSLASCSSDDEDYDVNNLAGTWERVYSEGVMDAGTEQYTFFPESSTSGRIELYVNSWPDFKQETTDLNYVVGHTGHMNIFTGKKHEGKSKVYGINHFLRCHIGVLTD